MHCSPACSAGSGGAGAASVAPARFDDERLDRIPGGQQSDRKRDEHHDPADRDGVARRNRAAGKRIGAISDASRRPGSSTTETTLAIWSRQRRRPWPRGTRRNDRKGYVATFLGDQFAVERSPRSLRAQSRHQWRNGKEVSSVRALLRRHEREAPTVLLQCVSNT